VRPIAGRQDKLQTRSNMKLKKKKPRRALDEEVDEREEEAQDEPPKHAAVLRRNKKREMDGLNKLLEDDKTARAKRNTKDKEKKRGRSPAMVEKDNAKKRECCHAQGRLLRRDVSSSSRRDTT
jgi:hypothetical protein